MKTIYLIYKTDGTNSPHGWDLHAVAIDKKPIDIIKEIVKKEGETLSEDNLNDLEKNMHINRYSGNGGFLFEAIEPDTVFVKVWNPKDGFM